MAHGHQGKFEDLHEGMFGAQPRRDHQTGEDEPAWIRDSVLSKRPTPQSSSPQASPSSEQQDRPRDPRSHSTAITGVGAVVVGALIAAAFVWGLVDDGGTDCGADLTSAQTGVERC
ncbi:hypothetical protein [Cellulosimicrobium sp. NPDC057127]|uniref:hypothetical protein n=1 Tax=Cellulosimicrobium sp. NPDC057127 TaxID=3346026 RepID=UPI0036452469